MKVLADTPVWSAALRRSAGEDSALRTELEWLVTHGAVAIMGPIRQELLSGIKGQAQFDQVRTALRHFPDVALQTEDFETAASYYNTCRGKGVQGSLTDFLICAVASRRRIAVFSTDQDFVAYEEILGLRMHASGD